MLQISQDKALYQQLGLACPFLPQQVHSPSPPAVAAFHAVVRVPLPPKPPLPACPCPPFAFAPVFPLVARWLPKVLGGGGEDEEDEEESQEAAAAKKSLERLGRMLTDMQEEGSYTTVQIAEHKAKMAAVPRVAKKKKMKSQKACMDEISTLSNKHWKREEELQALYEAASAECTKNIRLRETGLKNITERYKESVKQFKSEYDNFDEESLAKKVEVQNSINAEDVRFNKKVNRLNTALLKAVEGEPNDMPVDQEDAEDDDGFGLRWAAAGGGQAHPPKLRNGAPLAVFTNEEVDRHVINCHVLDDPNIAAMGLNPQQQRMWAASMEHLCNKFWRFVDESKVPTRKATPKPQTTSPVTPKAAPPKSKMLGPSESQKLNDPKESKQYGSDLDEDWLTELNTTEEQGAKKPATTKTPSEAAAAAAPKKAGVPTPMSQKDFLRQQQEMKFNQEQAQMHNQLGGTEFSADMIQQQQEMHMRHNQQMAEQQQLYHQLQMNAANAGRLPMGTVQGSSQDGNLVAAAATATEITAAKVYEEKSEKGTIVLDTAPLEKTDREKKLVNNPILKGSTQTNTLEKLKKERAAKERALKDTDEAIEEENQKDTEWANSTSGS